MKSTSLASTLKYPGPNTNSSFNFPLGGSLISCQLMLPMPKHFSHNTYILVLYHTLYTWLRNGYLVVLAWGKEATFIASLGFFFIILRLFLRLLSTISPFLFLFHTLPYILSTLLQINGLFLIVVIVACMCIPNDINVNFQPL